MIKENKRILVRKEMKDRPIPSGVKSGTLLPWVFVFLVGVASATTYNHRIGETVAYATDKGALEVTIVDVKVYYDAIYYAALFKNQPITHKVNGCQGGTDDICPHGKCKDPYEVTKQENSICYVKNTPIHECFCQKKCSYTYCEDKHIESYKLYIARRNKIELNMLINKKPYTSHTNHTSDYLMYNNRRIQYMINADEAIHTKYMAISNMLFEESEIQLLIPQFSKIQLYTNQTTYLKQPSIQNDKCIFTSPTFNGKNVSNSLIMSIEGSVTFELENLDDLITPVTFDKCYIDECIMNITNNVQATIYCVLQYEVCLIDIFLDDMLYSSSNMASNHQYHTVFYNDINMRICSKNCHVLSESKKYINQTTYVDTNEVTYTDEMTFRQKVLMVVYIIILIMLMICILVCLNNCFVKNSDKLAGDSNIMKPKVEITEDKDHYIVNPNTISGCGEFAIALYTKLKYGYAEFTKLNDSLTEFQSYCKRYAYYYTNDKDTIKNIGILIEGESPKFHAKLVVDKSYIEKYISFDLSVYSEQIINKYFTESFTISHAAYMMLPFLSEREIQSAFQHESELKFIFNPVPIKYRPIMQWLGYDFARYPDILKEKSIKYNSLDEITPKLLADNFKNVRFDSLPVLRIPWSVIKENLNIRTFRDEKYFIASIYYTKTQLRNYNLEYTFMQGRQLYPMLKNLTFAYSVPREVEKVIEICDNDYLTFMSTKNVNFLSPIEYRHRAENKAEEFTFNVCTADRYKSTPFLTNVMEIPVSLAIPVHDWSNGKADTCWAGPFYDYVYPKNATMKEIKNFFNRMGINVFIYNEQEKVYKGTCIFVLSIFIVEYADHVSTSYIYKTTFHKIATKTDPEIIITKIMPITINIQSISLALKTPTINVKKSKQNIKKHILSTSTMVTISPHLIKATDNIFYIKDGKYIGYVQSGKSIPVYKYRYDITEEDNVYTLINQVIPKHDDYTVDIKDQGIQVNIGNKFVLTNITRTSDKLAGQDLNDLCAYYEHNTAIPTGISKELIEQFFENLEIEDVDVFIDAAYNKELSEIGNEVQTVTRGQYIQLFSEAKKDDISNHTESGKKTVSETPELPHQGESGDDDTHKEVVDDQQGKGPETAQAVIKEQDDDGEEDQDIIIFSSKDDEIEIEAFEFPIIDKGEFMLDTLNKGKTPMKYAIIEHINAIKQQEERHNYLLFNVARQLSMYDPLTENMIKKRKKRFRQQLMANACYAFAFHNFYDYLNLMCDNSLPKISFFPYDFINGEQQDVIDYINHLNFPLHGESEEYVYTTNPSQVINNDLICAIVRPNTNVNAKNAKYGHYLFIWREGSQWFSADQFKKRESNRTIYKKKYNHAENNAILVALYRKRRIQTNAWDQIQTMEELINYNGCQPINSFITYYTYINTSGTNVAGATYNKLDWRLFNLLNLPIKLSTFSTPKFRIETKENIRFIEEHAARFNREVFNNVRMNDQVLNDMTQRVEELGLDITSTPGEIYEILNVFKPKRFVIPKNWISVSDIKETPTIKQSGEKGNKGEEVKDKKSKSSSSSSSTSSTDDSEDIVKKVDIPNKDKVTPIVKKHYLNVPKFDETKNHKFSMKNNRYYFPILSNNAMLESVKGYLRSHRCEIGDVIDDTQGHHNIHAINMYHKLLVMQDIVNYVNNNPMWQGRIIDINDSGTDFTLLEGLGRPILKFSHGTRDFHTGSQNIKNYAHQRDDIVIFCDCNYYPEYISLFNSLNVQKKYIIATYFDNYDGTFSEFTIQDNGTKIHIHGEGQPWYTNRTNMQKMIRYVKSYSQFIWGPMTMFCGVYDKQYTLEPMKFLPTHVATIIGASTQIQSDVSKRSSEMNRGLLTPTESQYFTELYNDLNVQTRNSIFNKQKTISLTGFLGYFARMFPSSSFLIVVQSNMTNKTYRSRFLSILEILQNVEGAISTLVVLAQKILELLTTPTQYDIEIASQIKRTSQSYAYSLTEMYANKEHTEIVSTVVTADIVAYHSLRYELKNMLTFFTVNHVNICGVTDKIKAIAAILYGLVKTKKLNLVNIISLLENLDTLTYTGRENRITKIAKDYCSVHINNKTFSDFFKDTSKDMAEYEVNITNMPHIHTKPVEEVKPTDLTIKPQVKQTLTQKIFSTVVKDITAPCGIASVWVYPAHELGDRYQEDRIYTIPLTVSTTGTMRARNIEKLNKYTDSKLINKVTTKDKSIEFDVRLPMVYQNGVIYILPKIEFLNGAFDVNNYYTWREVYNWFDSHKKKLQFKKGIIINNYSTIKFEKINLDTIEVHKKLFDSVVFNYHITTSAPNDVIYAYKQRFQHYISPDPVVLKDFEIFVEGEVRKMIPDVVRTITEQNISVEDYINHLKSDKKSEAQAVWNSIKQNPYIRVEKIFHLIPKHNEQIIADESKIPRVIMAPDRTKKLLVGYYSYIIESALIKIDKGFMIGKTGLEMLEEFKIYMNSKYQCYSLDGKSFDGHQHIELLRIVDNKFVDICKLIEAPEWFVNNIEILKNEHHRCYVSNRPMLALNSNKRAMTMYNFIGKTPSGHAFHTTVMNTFRSIMYMKYAAYVAGVSVKPYAAGDDTIVFIKKQDIELFTMAINKLFAHYGDLCRRKVRKDFVHGLGQVLKEFNNLPTPIFCSMVFNYNYVVKSFDNAVKRNLTWSQQPTNLILFARFLAITSWHLCPEIKESFKNYFGITDEEERQIPRDVSDRLVMELHYTPVSRGTQEFDISILPQSDMDLINFISNFQVVRRDEFMHNNRHDYLLYEMYDSSMFLDMPTKRQFKEMQERAWAKQREYDATGNWF